MTKLAELERQVENLGIGIVRGTVGLRLAWADDESWPDVRESFRLLCRNMDELALFGREVEEAFWNSANNWETDDWSWLVGAKLHFDWGVDVAQRYYGDREGLTAEFITLCAREILEYAEDGREMLAKLTAGLEDRAVGL